MTPGAGPDPRADHRPATRCSRRPTGAARSARSARSTSWCRSISYLNETTRHADVILPPTSALERDHYDLVFNALAVRNIAKYAGAVPSAAPSASTTGRSSRPRARVRARRRAAGRCAAGPARRGSARAAHRPRAAHGPPRPRKVSLTLAVRCAGAARHRPRPARAARCRERLRRRTADRPRAAPLVLADLPARTRSSSRARRTSCCSSAGATSARNNSWMHNSERLMRGRPRAPC